MALGYCDFELRIERHDDGRYFVAAWLEDPASDQRIQLLDPVEVEIDPEKLGQCDRAGKGYGEQLTAMLFGAEPGPVRLAFERARAVAATRDGLRFRLSIAESAASEMHALCWESLLDPSDKVRLATNETVWFSRFASGRNFRLLPVQEAAPLQALVVIANPTDLESLWHLPAITGVEFGRVTAALSKGGEQGGRPIHPRRLATPVSIPNIVENLRDSYADILCMVCHGLLRNGTTRLLLEGDDGTAELVDGEALVEGLGGMKRPPRLLVLSSCESAGDEQGMALAAVGPRLAEAGVPSVIAMQGQISVESAGRFMTRLFGELVKDGQIDRAVAVARGEIRARPDWWIPVLFMRLTTGSLWPAAQVDVGGFEQWDALLNAIAQDRCVPILGPGLVESTLGSTREIASDWAERHGFPLAPRNRDDLAQVAQYLTYGQSRSLAVDELRDYVVEHVRKSCRDTLERIGARLQKDLVAQPPAEGTLSDLILQIGREQRRTHLHDAHRLLALLPVRIFISANRDNLLRDALREADKEPQVLLCNWGVDKDAPRVFPANNLPDDYVPSKKKPLIFQVFGSFEHPDSLVLTEDDYFDFLITVTRNETLTRSDTNKISIPSSIANALASSGLLLLGFQVDDWDFRVLFRGILQQPGSPLGSNYARVAVQMSLTKDQFINPDRASKYLRRYFERAGRIDTFWGSAQEFMKILVDRCRVCGIIDAVGPAIRPGEGAADV